MLKYIASDITLLTNPTKRLAKFEFKKLVKIYTSDTAGRVKFFGKDLKLYCLGFDPDTKEPLYYYREIGSKYNVIKDIKILDKD